MRLEWDELTDYAISVHDVVSLRITDRIWNHVPSKDCGEAIMGIVMEGG